MRESCISHRPRQPIAVVRQDYYELMGNDATAAALMNIFEYWSNAAIARNPSDDAPWLGERTVKDFEGLMVGISTDKQIRKRLAIIKERGFIEIRQPKKHRKTLEYRFFITRVQAALDSMSNGQTTVEPTVKQPLSQRSNDQTSNGQTTVEPTVKQPLHYIQEEIKEEKKNKDTEECVVIDAEFEPIKTESAIIPSLVANTNQASTQETHSSQEVGSFGGRRYNNAKNTIRRFEAGEIESLPRFELFFYAEIRLGGLIKAYRKSGKILNSSPNDIDRGFISFIAKRDRKDSEYASRLILACERTPERWTELTEMAKSWKAKETLGYSREHVTNVHNILANIADL